MTTDALPDPKDDRLVGIAAIADFWGCSTRRAQYLAETRQLPLGKEGRIWVGSKRQLREYHARLTGAAA